MKRLIYTVWVSVLLPATMSAQTEIPHKAEEAISLGLEAMAEYNFNSAASHFATARKLLRKTPHELLDKYERDLGAARSFMERVENITILDSLTVPRAKFFEAYHLPPSAGRLSDSSILPQTSRNREIDFVFSNEEADYMLYAMPDSAGYYRLNETFRLTDGSWSSPSMLSADLAPEADALYPFMMPDGVTLYFASDAEGSMGGLDIFVATRDAADGSFLNPQNLGMPYNSPADDYLLAIDELNGVGWWATERNNLPDDVTVYLFKVNDLRKNYPADADDLVDHARIANWRAAWDDDDEEANTRLRDEVMAIRPTPVPQPADFYFPVSTGNIYTSLNDFKSQGARNAMQKYLGALREFEADTAKLDNLRRSYHKSHSKALVTAITTLENSLASDRDRLSKLKSEVYRILKSGK